jgi:hypothetical protein
MVFGEIAIAVIVALLLNWLTPSFLAHLNVSAYVQGLISFNSGIIIALFVALFHSSDSSIVAFKKFKLAASQVYTILIVNSILVCLCALFIPSAEATTEVVKGNTLQLIGTTLATIGSAVNVYIIYKLLSVYFRDK